MHSRLIAGQIPVMGTKSGNGLPGVWLQLARQFHRDGNDGSAKYSGNSARSVSSSGPKWTFEKTGLTQTSSGKDQVEGFQSREHEFSAGRSRDIQDRGVEHGEQDAGPEEEKVRIEKEKLDGHVRMKGTQERYENEVIDANGSPGVSLHSVMQSNVPEPFNPQGRNPTHLNMPGGGVMSSQKYLYDKIHKNHPSKQFSTSAAILGQAVMAAETNDYNIPCPQGVQGDDCVKFQLWLQNCQRYHLPNCDEQLQGIQTGRKTLAEIFNEQDALIRKISADFKSQPPNPEIQNLQDVQFSTPIQQSQIESYAPCPQGIQGEDCERYTQWLSNCSKYGLNNCADQLQGVQEGRRSLQSIFHEQEEMIRKIAFSNQTRSYSTSAPKGQEEGKEWY